MLGGFILNLTLGIVYAWSVFLKPLMNEFGWGAAETSLAFTLIILTLVIVMIPAGKLSDKIGPKKVASAGGVLFGLGFILASFTTSLPWLYLTYGVVAGAGVGLAYITPMSAGVKWFPDRKGLVTGIIVCGFGLGSALLAPAATYIINTMGWRSGFQIFGIVLLLISVASAQTLKIPDPSWSPPSLNPTSTSQNHSRAQNLTWRQMLITSKFWMIWTIYAFGATAGLMVIGHVANFAQESGIDAFPAALAVSMLAIFNGAGRISWGAISDRIGRAKPMLMMLLLQAIVLTLLIKATSVLSLFLAVAMVGFCYGGIFSILPSATADFFGTKHIGMNYSLVNTAYGVGGIVGPYLGGYIFDLTKSYYLAFQMAGILCAIAVVISLLLISRK